jgi:hypothetical protein
MNPRGRTIQGILILASLGFLLPFLSISCNGTKLVTLNGAQLMVGSKIPPPGGFGQPTTIPPNGIIIAAFVLGALSIFLRNTQGVARNGLLAISGTAAAAVVLIVFQMNAASQVRQQTLATLTLDMEPGYWVALVGYAAATLIGLFDLGMGRKTPEVPMPVQVSVIATPPPLDPRLPPPPLATGTPHVQRFCTACGSSRSPTDRFCPSCGAPA